MLLPLLLLLFTSFFIIYFYYFSSSYSSWQNRNISCINPNCEMGRFRSNAVPVGLFILQKLLFVQTKWTWLTHRMPFTCFMTYQTIEYSIIITSSLEHSSWLSVCSLVLILDKQNTHSWIVWNKLKRIFYKWKWFVSYLNGM